MSEIAYRIVYGIIMNYFMPDTGVATTTWISNYGYIETCDAALFEFPI